MNLIERAKQALECATQGRRVQFHGSYCKEAEGTPFTAWDTSHDTSVIRPDGTLLRGYSHHKHASDAAVDALSPDLARLAVAAGELADQVQRVKDFRYDPRIGIELNLLEESLARFRAIAEGKE
jgi:hypothetical protein